MANTFFQSIYQEDPPEAPIGIIESRPQVFEFIIKPRARKGSSPDLTLDDRREIAKTGLTDEKKILKAKAAFHEGGGIAEIEALSGYSRSSAEKLHRALKIALENHNRKNGG